jgi:guanylate kinase
MRPTERHGLDYIFVSEAEFQGMVEARELLEWAMVYGRYYGVPKAQVREALARGQDVIIKADVQGAATIKGLAPQAVMVFLAPTSLEELEQHLRDRKTEDLGDLERRLRTANEEMRHLPEFDYVVVNQDGALDETVARLDAILTAERCRYPTRVVEL